MTEMKLLFTPILVGLLTMAQTAFADTKATNELTRTSTSNMTITVPPPLVYKYWLVYPDKKIQCNDIHCKGGQWWWWAYEWSNDPSYQYGFNYAKTNYQNVYSGDEFSMDFQVTNNDVINICHAKTVADPDSCIHGYVRGFQQWCRTNTEECTGAAIHGTIPIRLMTFGGYDNGWPQPNVLKPVVEGYHDPSSKRPG
jgi:hypothetical protein